MSSSTNQLVLTEQTALTDFNLKGVYFSSCFELPERLARNRFKRGVLTIEFNTVNKLCPKCNEFWPLTREFWCHSKKTADKAACLCKACEADRREGYARLEHVKRLDDAGGLTFRQASGHVFDA